MAQFDVLEVRDEGVLVVDVQSDLLGDRIESRVVIPLQRQADTPWQFSRLTPRLEFDGNSYVLGTLLMTALPRSELRGPLGSLEGDRYTILNAIDFLLNGI